MREVAVVGEGKKMTRKNMGPRKSRHKAGENNEVGPEYDWTGEHISKGVERGGST